MKTEDLVTLLATDAGAVETNAVLRRYVFALVCGAVAAGVLMVGLLGIRHDLGKAMLQPMFWVKLGFVAALASTSGIFAWRLARPGASLAWVPGVTAAPVVAIGVLAALVLANADPGQWRVLVFGATAGSCPWFIALLSAPVFIAMMWAMRGLAPTRLRLAGAATGFASGSLGALVYAFHCPEMAAPFLAIWYLLGILIPAGVGAVLGPRLLRW